MDFSDHYLAILVAALALLMALIAAVNWLNRRHGGFITGWASAVFIGVCWFASMAIIVLRLRS